MAAHARLKNEITENEKYHNLITWLKYMFLSLHVVLLGFVCIYTASTVKNCIHLNDIDFSFIISVDNILWIGPMVSVIHLTPCVLNIMLKFVKFCHKIGTETTLCRILHLAEVNRDCLGQSQKKKKKKRNKGINRGVPNEPNFDRIEFGGKNAEIFESRGCSNSW